MSLFPPSPFRLCQEDLHPTCTSEASLCSSFLSKYSWIQITFAANFWTCLVQDVVHALLCALCLTSYHCKAEKPHSNSAIVGERKKSLSDENADWLHSCRDCTALTPNCQQITRGILHVGTLLTWLKVTSVISFSQGLVSHIGLLLGHSSKLTLVTCPFLAGLWTFIKLEKNMVFYQKPQQACLY